MLILTRLLTSFSYIDTVIKFSYKNWYDNSHKYWLLGMINPGTID